MDAATCISVGLEEISDILWDVDQAHLETHGQERSSIALYLLSRSILLTMVALICDSGTMRAVRHRLTARLHIDLGRIESALCRITVPHAVPGR